MNPLFVDYFKHFANTLFEHFGDRIKQWITFNEPFNLCLDGYSIGRFAPGVKVSGVGEYLCGHHLLLAHAAAYHLYKKNYFTKQQGKVGISLNTRFAYPKDETVDQNLVEKVMNYKVRLT